MVSIVDRILQVYKEYFIIKKESITRSILKRLIENKPCLGNSRKIVVRREEKGKEAFSK